MKRTWKGALQRTNKLGDKEEVAKLKEVSELNQKLEEYEKKKQARLEAIAHKRAANPKVQVGKGTVLTPEQIAMRYGNIAKKKQAPDARLPAELQPKVTPEGDPDVDAIDFEGLAKRSMNTRAELGGPPQTKKTAAEEAFEKSLYGPGSTPVTVDDSEFSRYKAGEQRFAEIRHRRQQLEAERLEAERLRRK